MTHYASSPHGPTGPIGRRSADFSWRLHTLAHLASLHCFSCSLFLVENCRWESAPSASRLRVVMFPPHFIRFQHVRSRRGLRLVEDCPRGISLLSCVLSERGRQGVPTPAHLAAGGCGSIAARASLSGASPSRTAASDEFTARFARAGARRHTRALPALGTCCRAHERTFARNPTGGSPAWPGADARRDRVHASRLAFGSRLGPALREPRF